LPLIDAPPQHLAYVGAVTTDPATRCVVVGGGPGGVMLAYLLARGGVAVTLLESRPDFDRQFRGDTLAPPVLELLDTLGLADPLLSTVPHGTANAFMWSTPTRSYRLADYRRTSAKYPYYALVPQGRFLPFMVAEAARFPGFRVEMGARVSTLMRDDGGRVTGVEYVREGERHRLSAELVVGADGRNSKVRTLSSITATELGAHLDICWFEVPRRDGDPPLSGLGLIADPGTTLAVLGQAASWQLGYTIPAGGFPALRAAGIGPVTSAFRRRLPWLGDRLDGLTEVNQLSLLPVRITRTDRWSEPGLLLIGDAAHVISPVGGNGVNYAVLDAVEAANRLVGALSADPVDPAAVDAATAAVEAARRPQVERDQLRQKRTERSAAKRLRSGDPRPPVVLRLLSAVPAVARLVAARGVRALAAPPVDDRILHPAAGVTPRSSAPPG
jgi:2-polyprenyl-6-methoxyphenol hydroxylase-like FAD-dependent oxidoreductase